MVNVSLLKTNVWLNVSHGSTVVPNNRPVRKRPLYEGVQLKINTAPAAPPKMRRLTKKKALTLVKELDAFPKVPESYVESTASGGTGIDTTTNTSCSSRGVTFNFTTTLTHVDALSSVSDSLHSHGCTCLPGVLRVQKHMDEVWVWGGQRLQQVRAKSVIIVLKICALSLYTHLSVY